MRGQRHRLLVAVCVSAALGSPLRAQQQPPQPTPPGIAVTVDVIGATPLPGLDLPLDQIPAPAQSATSRDLDASGAADLSDFLNRRLNGVHVNEIQGNPFQPDVNYRGYTASPLLGTPQGLSVYLDGVRLNQPFGDVVSWDLIPRIAIASTTLMPGSNPLFGLNTLGGALAVQTKDGRASPGSSLQATYGSHARRALEFESGSSGRSASFYMAGTLFGDDGWRDSSPSSLRQVFSKTSWKSATTNAALTAAYANNSLTGNGLQDQRLLDQRYAGVYTLPDTTDNHATFVTLAVVRALSPARSLSWNTYYRDLRTSTLNGDINGNALDQAVYQPSAADRVALAAAGYTGVPATITAANTPFPSWRCLAQALQRDEPAEKCNGLINRTSATQYNYGGSAQWTAVAGSNLRAHRFTAGVAYDGSRLDFTQSTELGYVNADRSVTGVGAFGDGITGGTVNGSPFDTRVDLGGTVNTGSVYATDTLSIGGALHLTASGRYNRTTIRNSDRIHPGAGDGSLDGDHAFARFNPALGLTLSASRAVNLYAGYSEGSRAPTSIELGCANPNQPCTLPNAMAGDPPLDQVVTRTWEAGARGGFARNSRVSWTLGAFRATNADDILFVSSTQSGFGYFRNFGSTRRQGVEADVRGRWSMVTAGAGYTYLDATYQSAETIDASGNSTNSAAIAGAKGLDGTIRIASGDRIPLIPQHVFKAFADVEFAPALSLDVDLVAVSGSYARGNENNLHQPDGTYYLGDGTVAGYAIVNGGSRYQLTRALQLIAQVNNVFDRRYATAAQLGATGLTSAGTFIARPLPAVNGEFPVQHATFVAPGAPRAFWLGLRVKFLGSTTDSRLPTNDYYSPRAPAGGNSLRQVAREDVEYRNVVGRPVRRIDRLSIRRHRYPPRPRPRFP